MGSNAHSLLQKYGLLIGSSKLATLLGYPSLGAFRTAVYRGTVEIPLFLVKGRRGKFALVSDVEQWISKVQADRAGALARKEV